MTRDELIAALLQAPRFHERRLHYSIMGHSGEEAEKLAKEEHAAYAKWLEYKNEAR